MPMTLKPAFLFVAIYLARHNVNYHLLALKLWLSNNFLSQTLTPLNMPSCSSYLPLFSDCLGHHILNLGHYLDRFKKKIEIISPQTVFLCRESVFSINPIMKVCKKSKIWVINHCKKQKEKTGIVTGLGTNTLGQTLWKKDNYLLFFITLISGTTDIYHPCLKKSIMP